MRRLPPVGPDPFDRDVYLVLGDFGDLGHGWSATDEERTDRETVIRGLLEGQYSDPVRIVAFNTVEGWSRDVSEELAEEIARRSDLPRNGNLNQCRGALLERRSCS